MVLREEVVSLDLIRCVSCASRMQRPEAAGGNGRSNCAQAITGRGFGPAIPAPGKTGIPAQTGEKVAIAVPRCQTWCRQASPGHGHSDLPAPRPPPFSQSPISARVCLWNSSSAVPSPLSSQSRDW